MNLRLKLKNNFGGMCSMSRNNLPSLKTVAMTMFRKTSFRWILLMLLGVIPNPRAIAHPGHAHARPAGQGDALFHRYWLATDGSFCERGHFVVSRDGYVQIRRDDNVLVTLPIDKLSEMDRSWIQQKTSQRQSLAHQGILLVAQNQGGKRTGRSNADEIPAISRAFEAFVKRQSIKTRWDDRYFYVESNGIPQHPMMVGITAWQQQVPLPQTYFGDNAWQIPLHPVPAQNPRTTKNAFLRGAIAVAVNGIPIFNPLNNRGDDAYLFGELDEYGGHCGRADDYHYHLAPVHLQETVGPSLPIAFALDGYPIYGYTEPDGSEVKGLDAFNGHQDAQGNYHYHATKKYPYLNGGFHGEVIERDGQVDPQPRAEPMRPALPPLRGAKITQFVESRPGTSRLTYEIQGKPGTVTYSLLDNGSYQFDFVDITGKATSETYRRRGSAPGKQPAPPPRPGMREENRGAPAPNTSAPSETGKEPASKRFSIRSNSIDARGFLAASCTCDGAGQSPALSWSDPPQGTKCFAISLWHTAPDQEKSYWVIYNIPANVREITANAKNVGTLGMNDKRRAEYDPMCSKGPGVKTYHITIYALSAIPRLAQASATRGNLLTAIRDLKLGEATLDFKYERR